ncbi:MAG: hypothetical protein RR585_11740 [Coprobacillus sp.]
MNKEKWHKDRVTLYMFRNVFSTLIAAMLAFLISFMLYYHCDLAQAIQRLFIYDIYTTLYFILIWMFDYFVFETSKIVYDIYEEKVTFVPSLILIAISIFIFFVPIRDVFQYNFCFLSLLICMRMVREMWRRTPELFKTVHLLVNKIKKRPDSGLE